MRGEFRLMGGTGKTAGIRKHFVVGPTSFGGSARSEMSCPRQRFRNLSRRESTSGEIPVPPHVQLAGFAEFTPAQDRLFEAMRRKKQTLRFVRRRPRGGPSFCSAGCDSLILIRRSEPRPDGPASFSKWLHIPVAAEPSIGIVVPELSKLPQSNRAIVCGGTPSRRKAVARSGFATRVQYFSWTCVLRLSADPVGTPNSSTESCCGDPSRRYDKSAEISISGKGANRSNRMCCARCFNCAAFGSRS